MTYIFFVIFHYIHIFHSKSSKYWFRGSVLSCHLQKKNWIYYKAGFHLDIWLNSQLLQVCEIAEDSVWQTCQGILTYTAGNQRQLASAYYYMYMHNYYIHYLYIYMFAQFELRISCLLMTYQSPHYKPAYFRKSYEVDCYTVVPF